MRAKKKMIARMALGAATALALAAVVAVVALLKDAERYQRHAVERKARQDRRVEESRAYLAELAKRIDRLPVDANLAAEIESRFFADRPAGPFYVWAVDDKGQFAFGVPEAAFERLNAIYDREITPRLKEGVFLDRQSFLLGLIDESDDIGSGENVVGDAAELVRRGRWRLGREETGRSFILSAPLKTPTGAALGSIYLKRSLAIWGDPGPDDDHFKAAVAGAGIVATISFIFLWVLLPTWVYVDARERGVRRAPLFAFLTVLSSVIGLVVYLIARPEHGRTLACPGCSREVDGGAFCPHCGRDLSRSFCPACRYPLQADWAYCPACRTETGSKTLGAPVTEAG
jgi:hypothetical protein